MNLVLRSLLPLDFLLIFLNAAVASLLACGLGLVFSRRGSLPARHAILVVSLASSLVLPAFVSLVRLPSLLTINISAATDAHSPALIMPTDEKTVERQREEPVVSPAALTEAVLLEPTKQADVVAETPPVARPVVSAPNVVAKSLPTRQAEPTSAIPWPRLIATLVCDIWLLGSLIGLSKLGIGLVRRSRWVQSVTIVDDPMLVDMARQAAVSLGLRIPLPIYRSNLLPAPVTFGLLRPRIVLPANIEANMPADQLRAVIQHEMAHIARRDLWTGLLQAAASIAYWWNPLVLLVNRRIADWREQICDDIAIRDLTETSFYATTLVTLAERCNLSTPFPATLGIGMSPASQLEGRIHRILSSTVIRSAGLTRLALVGVSATILMMTATILVAQVQVKPEGKEKADGQINGGKVDPAPGPQPAVQDKQQQGGENAGRPPEGGTPTEEPEPEPERDPFDQGWGKVEVPGQVVDPDGNPVAGATVFLRKFGVRVPSKMATTDADGQFKFTTYRRLGPANNGQAQNPAVTTTKLFGLITITITEGAGASRTDEDEIQSIKRWIVATAPGYGFGIIEPGADVVIKLVPDQPITGRITDHDGTPVPGARIRVRDVHWLRTPDDPIAKMEDRRGEGPLPPIPDGEGLDPWLATMGRAANMNDYFVARRYMVGIIEFGSLGNKPAVYAPLIPPVTTDKEGRFSLPGIGLERVAELYVEGAPNHASALILAANRLLEQPILVAPKAERVKQFLSASDADVVVFGNKVKLALEPGRTIEGVITDRVSGDPVPGLRVVGPTVSRLEYPGFDRFFTTTDKDGHYRIDNFPVMKKARFKVETSEDRHVAKTDSSAPPYFGREVYVDIKPGRGPQQVDFSLARGVWITGKVVDAATGQGLDGQTVEYYPFKSNPFLKKDLDAKQGPEFDNNLRTKSDGTFKLRAYPGRGVVIAGGGDNYLYGIGANEIEGLKENEVYENLYGLRGSSPYIRNTTIEVNVPEDAEDFKCVLRLKKGKSRVVQVVDSDGAPVGDLEASGLDNQIENPITKVDSNFLNITNLFPGERREVVARCVPRKLMGMAIVTDDGAKPVTLTVVPWANVTGRLVDDAGEPRFRGLRIQLEDGKLPIHTLNGLNYDKQEFLIEPDGTFHIDGLVPEAKYRLQVVEGSFRWLGDATEDFTLKPGETRKLGDLKVIERKEEKDR